MPKPKKPIREMHRWEKMMAGATDMEELLVKCLAYIGNRHEVDGDLESLHLHGEILRQLFRTGRMK